MPAADQYVPLPPPSQSTAAASHRGAADSDVPKVLVKAISSKVLGTQTGHPAALFYDVDAYRSILRSANEAFGSHFVHCKAVKSNPLTWALREAISQGLGLECASINEVHHSLRCGATAKHVIFDSPCKTREDIHTCLKLGVHINCDNLAELDRVIAIRAALAENSNSTVGVRINPLLGCGGIEALSVSNIESKFAVALNDENRATIVSKFVEHPWLCCIHVHVGSQGCPLSMLAEGAKIAVDLADDIDKKVGKRQVSIIDIGGGLPVNFGSEVTTPAWPDYVSELRKATPTLFSDPSRKIFTEFGRAIDAKVGWFASEVEYVKPAGPRKSVAIIHAGSDMFLRECYAPKDFEKRLSDYKPDGTFIAPGDAVFDVAGPLCFGGDKVRRGAQIGTLSEGDFVVVHDAGANCLSLFSRHCSRSAPPVYGYWRDAAAEGGFSLCVIKEAEAIDDTLKFWGTEAVAIL